jgi:hypothetical protein
MFSITLKRSAATLGVVAGLLAAAAPASAQILDGPVLAKAGLQPVEIGIAPLHDKERGEVLGVEPLAKAPASPTSEVFTSVSNVALQGDAAHAQGIVPGGAIISSST